MGDVCGGGTKLRVWRAGATPLYVCPGIIALHNSRRTAGAQLSLGLASEDPSRAIEGRTGLSNGSAGCVNPTRAHPGGRIHSWWRYSPRRWLAATALGLGCRIECACYDVIALVPTRGSSPITGATRPRRTDARPVKLGPMGPTP